MCRRVACSDEPPDNHHLNLQLSFTVEPATVRFWFTLTALVIVPCFQSKSSKNPLYINYPASRQS